MADNSFCYPLIRALAHLSAAVDELETARHLPTYNRLDPSIRKTLNYTRRTLTNRRTTLLANLYVAIDSTYGQPKLPDNVRDALQTAQRLIRAIESDNAEPPCPE